MDDNPNVNSDEEDGERDGNAGGGGSGSGNGESSIVASSKFIQLSGIKSDVESTSADCYYPNNGNSVVFRETTV